MSRRRIRKLITFSLSVLVLIAVLIGNIQSIKVGHKFNILGYRPIVIVSGSMLPSIQINSLSIMSYCNLDDLEVGDVAVYEHPRTHILITHRVIEKHMDVDVPYMIVKGDANIGPDRIDITDEILVGKVVETYNWTVPIFDKIVKNERLDSMALILFILVVGCIISVAMVIFNFILNLIYYSYLAVFNKRYLDKFSMDVKRNIRDINETVKSMPELSVNNFDRPESLIGKIILITKLKNFNDACLEFKSGSGIAFKIGNWKK